MTKQHDPQPVAWMLEWGDYTEFRAADDMPAAWDDEPPVATPLYAAAQPAAQPADILTSVQAHPGGFAVAAALEAAVSALYFEDSSKYRAALGKVVRMIDPALAGDLLSYPKSAYDQTTARLDAARANQDGGTSAQEGAAS